MGNPSSVSLEDLDKRILELRKTVVDQLSAIERKVDRILARMDRVVVAGKLHDVVIEGFGKPETLARRLPLEEALRVAARGRIEHGMMCAVVPMEEQDDG